MDDVGRAARAVIRSIEELRVANGGDIRTPVALPNGGTLRIETNGLHLNEIREHGLDPTKNDNRILAASLGQAVHGRTIVVSNDAALRIKAAQLGLEAMEHQRLRGRMAVRAAGGLDHHRGEPGHGRPRLRQPDRHRHRRARRRRRRPCSETSSPTATPCCGPAASRSSSATTTASSSRMLRVPEPWGLRPRSKEQQFALDLLLDPEVRVVALDGMAGTGKTHARPRRRPRAGDGGEPLRQGVGVPARRAGRARPSSGFLPGTLDEKLNPWMTAVHDALVALTERRSHADARAVLEELTEREKLSLEAVTYLRGRSLHGTYVLVDEAQNLEPTTLKTILTRVGEGTKVVFTGDTSQIDAPYLSEHNNAVSVLIDAFDGERCFGHVRLSHCERSEVASLAALRL